MILWLVEIGNIHVVCTARNREYAKSKAHAFIGGNPDDYTVTPLTEAGDRLHLDITVWV